PKKAEALDAPRVLDALETPDALEKPGALLTPDVLGAPEGQRTLEAPVDPGTLKRDPAREADVPDALSTLVLPAALGMLELSATLDVLELPDTLDTLGTPGEPDALLDDVSMALLVAGCFVMVMGTATTAVKRAMRAIKRMVCYRMLIDRVCEVIGRALRRTGMLVSADARVCLYIYHTQPQGTCFEAR
ncbi:hypothetical protein EV121DRAFT_209168, partial [Schizophyllum commune]